MKQPKKMTLNGSIIERTIYGSYVNPKDDGMAQQKNAISYEQAIKYGYKEVK